MEPFAGPVLAFDFGSRVATAAVARSGVLLASIEAEREARDADLLPLVEACLERAGVGRRELAAVAALAGPGSFTGVRVACATALGLADALGIVAFGEPTLEAYALAAPAGAGRVLAVVDALRGEWFGQAFERGAGLDVLLDAVPLGEPRIASAGELAGADAGRVAGPDAARFAAEAGLEPATALTLFRAAEAAALAASQGRWRAGGGLLERPLHLRSPAARAARPR
jgi:tRNA threonylcarbamoyl adenosine modification protein YeaZ